MKKKALKAVTALLFFALVIGGYSFKRGGTARTEASADREEALEEAQGPTTRSADPGRTARRRAGPAPSGPQKRPPDDPGGKAYLPPRHVRR
jgi:hypothetical protein